MALIKANGKQSELDGEATQITYMSLKTTGLVQNKQAAQETPIDNTFSSNHDQYDILSCFVQKFTQ